MSKVDDVTITTTSSISKRAHKTSDPGRWVAVTELPGGLVAYALYSGSEPLGHGIREDKTLDEVVREAVRKLP